MFVPFMSKLSLGNSRLWRREEASHGSSGHGSSSHGSSGDDESHGSSSSSSSHSSEGGGDDDDDSEPVSVSGTSKTSSAASSGGGKAITIPSGQLFSGRTEGGGTREEIYGGSYYGSGYPGYTGRGVYGRPFPFYYWPVVWGGHNGSYLNDQAEYGAPSNISRPGGPMGYTTYASSSSNTTFHVLADNSTLASLLIAINATCANLANPSITSSPLQAPLAYDASNTSQPQPESAVQYYRASSIALTLDGYNNTGALSNDSGAVDLPLPAWADKSLLACLNSTIGTDSLLVNGAVSRGAGAMGLAQLFWLGWLAWALSKL